MNTPLQLRLAAIRHWAGLVIYAVTAIVALVAIYLTAVFVLEAVLNLPSYFRDNAAWERNDLSWQEYLYVAQQRLLIIDAVLLYIGLFIVPFVVSLPISAPLIALWREPSRFLFLRPFNRRPLTRGLSKIVRRDLSRFGHTYTLADANIYVPIYVRIPLVLGQFALLSFRTRKIRKARQLRKLDKAIRRTWLRNINWCLSWRKVFAVATTDQWWQQVVERLLVKSSVLFIDLTEFRKNVRWEVDLILRLGVEKRVIYLLRDGMYEAPLKAVTDFLGYTPSPDRLHFYDGRGARNPPALRQAVSDCIQNEHSLEGAPLRSSDYLSIVPVLMFMAGCVPLLALAFPGVNLGLPTWKESVGGYLDDTRALIVSAYGVLTFLLLIVSSYWKRGMVFLVAVQLLLLLGAFWGLVIS
jgi:hypothetical protein